MRTSSHALALSFLAALLLAPVRSAAGVLAPEPGCITPTAAVADFVDAWLGSFMTNGIAGFPKLCEKICKEGIKGCDRVRRDNLSCNLDSLDALAGVDAIQCRETPEPGRTACLQDVAELVFQRRALFASDATGASNSCAAAANECVAFCTGNPI